MNGTRLSPICWLSSMLGWDIWPMVVANCLGTSVKVLQSKDDTAVGRPRPEEPPPRQLASRASFSLGRQLGEMTLLAGG